MRQRFLIILFIALLVAGLIGLNAISYTRADREPDSEYNPNRSSYNPGASGTSALYDLMSETGVQVTRWQQPPTALLSPSNAKITTLITVGETLRPVTEDEAKDLLTWVSDGGRLVLIDRMPARELLNANAEWQISAFPAPSSLVEGEPKPEAMIDKVTAAKPAQPSTLTHNITAVQPSKFASKILLTYKGHDDAVATPTPKPAGGFALPPKAANAKALAEPSPNAAIDEAEYDDEVYEDFPTAPVIHLANPEKDLLVEIPYGYGKIIFLSDPFIVSNAGIKFVDNAILARNLGDGGGVIAFNEFHQGFGGDNGLIKYFSGTPVLAIFGQVVVLVLFAVWTQGRRFARPVPLPAKDRRSKLEYVAAMADLQQGTRSYDLAIENIYSQAKRDMIRLIGADNTISKKDLAQAIAERGHLQAKDLYILMSKCEDIIHGEPTNAKETMNLISQLRTLEEKLGFSRSKVSKFK